MKKMTITTEPRMRSRQNTELARMKFTYSLYAELIRARRVREIFNQIGLKKRLNKSPNLVRFHDRQWPRRFASWHLRKIPIKKGAYLIGEC